MSHDLTLFGVGTSRTMGPHWMLLELRLDYESRPLHSRSGETLTDEFKRLNPRHKIPVLQHKSFVLTESAAIIQYLSETFADRRAGLVPVEVQGRAPVKVGGYFIIGALHARSPVCVRPAQAP